MSVFWWIAIAIGLGVIEVLSADLIFLMLAFAALVAAGGSAFGLSFTMQMVVFTIAALVLLLTVRPWGKRILTRHTPNIQTNAQALPGRTALVTELVTPSGGRVRLDGEVWSARSATSENFAAGTRVFVEAIDGATAVVTRADIPPSPQGDPHSGGLRPTT
ncbi:MAG: NfeD family protein [Actinomycetaceae bacterium]|nr:NfeD family protein [Actinomycetaceae bacterium]